MSEAINDYGDKRVATKTGHGVDIASQRADDLDMMAIEHIRLLADQGDHPLALDVGCGHGGQLARMIKAGAGIVGLDIEDYQAQIRESIEREWPGSTNYVFVKGSVEQRPLSGQFDVIVCQRMIHYLPYDTAKAQVIWLRELIAGDGRLFISASGLDSELGNGYAHKALPLYQRFSQLAPEMAEKHSIYPPVCLYRLEDLTQLLEESGWVIECGYVSSFGNIKVVAKPREMEA